MRYLLLFIAACILAGLVSGIRALYLSLIHISHPIAKGCILERPKVVYNKKTKKYVMWFHLELRGKGYGSAYALSLIHIYCPTVPFSTSGNGTASIFFFVTACSSRPVFPMEAMKRQRPWRQPRLKGPTSPLFSWTA